MSETFQLDPAPEEWLSDLRLDSLRSELGNSVSLLGRADVLSVVLRSWILRELGESDDNRDAPLSWARSQWGHRLDNLFLHRKDFLDEASCRIIRVKQQGLALELYHRLKAQEATFEELSIKYGIGPEKFYGGMWNQQTLVSFPASFGQFLRKLEPGELAKPLKVGDQFMIVQLISFVPALYGEESSLKLLEYELNQWLDGMTSHLETLLTSTMTGFELL